MWPDTGWTRADVIAIEPPGGSRSRLIGPFAEARGDGAAPGDNGGLDANERSTGPQRLLALGTKARLARRREVDEIVGRWTASRPGEEAMEQLQAVGVAAYVVQNSAESLADPQLTHRGHFVEVPHEAMGTTWVEGSRFHLSRTSPRVARGADPRAAHLGGGTETAAVGQQGPAERLTSSSMATATVPKLRKALKTKAPGLSEERSLWDAGCEFVVGIDEVGRGSWAGPLTIGAAVVPRDRRINKVRDSKALTEPEREAMFDRIAEWCQAWSIGHASHEECDRLGMSAAQKLAAKRAIDMLEVAPDAVILDGKWDFVGHPVTRKLVKGDATCLSIAAASILAKVTRDRIMRAEAEQYPGFDFELNKGYPCPRHKLAINAYGPTAIHRRSWVFMDGLPWTGCRRLPPAGAANQIQLF